VGFGAWVSWQFTFFYKRFTWGYDFVGKGLALFNFVGIFAILLGNLTRSYAVVPLLMIGGFLFCVVVGWVVFDKWKLKTRFAEHDGDRNEYWTCRLSPIQKKTLLVYLDAIENPAKIKKLKELVGSGKL